ncbi:MAG: prepilin-type N-terminal cleavage/methylation domain-containing protein [Desulforhopalus sp.]
MRTSKTIRNQKGFTLIEVMIAMVILGFGLLAVGSLQTKNMALNSSSKRQTEGYNFAMDKIERLLTESIDVGDLTVTGSSPTSVGDGRVLTSADIAELGSYTIELDVLNNDINIPNTRRVFVFVRQNVGGVPKEVARVNFLRTQASF